MIPTISLQGAGKKYGKEWIFRNLNCTLHPQSRTVILGGNGSGKSTLLQVLSGFITLNEGTLKYESGEQAINEEHFREHVALASPYLQLVEDYSVSELIEHACKFKPLVIAAAQDIIDELQLPATGLRPVKHFSSGMKQKLRLGLAILSAAPILLLDEPVSNLDPDAIKWYSGMMEKYTRNKSVVVCSNAIEAEYASCTAQIQITDYKPAIKLT